jgi:hypothetical protein
VLGRLVELVADVILQLAGAAFTSVMRTPSGSLRIVYATSIYATTPPYLNIGPGDAYNGVTRVTFGGT